MAELDKVIKGLKELSSFLFREYGKAHAEETNLYYDRFLAIEDAIELLKEQKATEPDTDSEGTCTCGNCGETVGYYPVGYNKPKKLCKFCPECGQAVKWE